MFSRALDSVFVDLAILDTVDDIDEIQVDPLSNCDRLTIKSCKRYLALALPARQEEY